MSRKGGYELGYRHAAPTEAGLEIPLGEFVPFLPVPPRTQSSLHWYLAVLSVLGGVLCLTALPVGCSVGSGDAFELKEEIRNEPKELQRYHVSWEACWQRAPGFTVSRILSYPVAGALFASGVALNYPYYAWVQLHTFLRYFAGFSTEQWLERVATGSTFLELIGAIICSSVVMSIDSTSTTHNVGFVMWICGSFAFGALFLVCAVVMWYRKKSYPFSGRRPIIVLLVRAGCSTVLTLVSFPVLWIDIDFIRDTFSGKQRWRQDYRIRLIESVYILVHVATACCLVIAYQLEPHATAGSETELAESAESTEFAKGTKGTQPAAVGDSQP